MNKNCFLLSISILLFAMTGCQTVINNENIIGTWKVSDVQVASLNEKLTDEIIHRTEDRIRNTTYTFLENAEIKTLEVGRDIQKGGDYILDEQRMILTISETYKEFKINSALWQIEMSSSESMTLFHEIPGKYSTRMTLLKMR